MGVDEALAELEGVDPHQFMGALAWLVGNERPITAKEWKETADQFRK